MEQFRRVDDLIVNAPDMLAAAIIHEDRRYRYQDIHDGMIDVAGTLVSLNLYTDKIIVLLGNRPEAVMAIMGIAYAGGTFIPLPNTVRSHRLAEVINDSGATAIITDDSFRPIVDELGIDDTPTLRCVIGIEDLTPYHQNKDHQILRSKPAYPAALMYTSGTTGRAKGVICPHHKIMEAVESINAYLMHTSHDLVATPLPLSHGYGLYQVLTLLDAGGSVMLENNFSFPQQTLERMQKYHANGFAAVPSMIHMLMQTEGWADYLGDIEYITTAGAALPPSTFSMLKDELPYVQILPMYGQAECVRALYYSNTMQRVCKTHLNSCGSPIPGTKTRVFRKGKKFKKGEGELLVKSKHVMDGYWNDPDETSKTFVDGWLHTGDIFGIDADGLHYFMGRNDEVVKIKGERCSPQELDNALIEMPEIDEAASFVVDDSVWGKRFVAYVSSKDYVLTKNDVKRYCKRTLSPFLMPKDVVVVGSIPKTDTGKISRKALKAMYEIMISGE